MAICVSTIAAMHSINHISYRIYIYMLVFMRAQQKPKYKSKKSKDHRHICGVCASVRWSRNAAIQIQAHALSINVRIYYKCPTNCRRKSRNSWTRDYLSRTHVARPSHRSATQNFLLYALYPFKSISDVGRCGFLRKSRPTTELW